MTTNLALPSSGGAGSGGKPGVAAVHGVGVNVVPTELLDSGVHQPTGVALAQTMQRYGVQMVRLAWGNQYSMQLDNSGWRTVFNRLADVHINVILTLHQQPPGVSEGPGVTDATITDVNAVVRAEEGVLSSIRRQFGGSYPANLVALDVFNEPVLNTTTVSSLQSLASQIKVFSGGIPVTIGGWRNAGPNVVSAYNDPSLTGLAASIGDFVSPHLYPDNMPNGGGLTTTNVADMEPSAVQFLTTTFAQLAASGHMAMPVLIGETNGENGQATSGGFHPGISGSPAHQEATVQAVFQAADQFVGQGLRGVLIWWMTPPPSEICNGGALICFDGAYTSPALDLLASHQFN